jgi:flagellar biosynthesis protein FliP
MNANTTVATRDRRPHVDRALVFLLVSFGALAAPAAAQLDPPGPQPNAVPNGRIDAPSIPPLDPPDLPGANGLPIDPEEALAPRELPSTLKVLALLTVLSLAPAVLLMTTCFVRFVVVFGLLRQALGTQQLPPNQVLISLSLFLTLLVMGPVWQRAYDAGVRPYAENPNATVDELPGVFERTAAPLKGFMLKQIEATGNERTIWTFLDFRHPDGGPDEIDVDELPLDVLLPAFMLSELKTSFVIGFQLYLPFLVIDMVVASVLISMGMMMLPPVLVSLPFKLLLFVLIDGWHLVVGMLLESVAPFG